MENVHYIISKILILMSYGLITILILTIPIGIYSIYRLIYPGTLRVAISNDNSEKKISEKDLNYNKIIELMTASSNNSANTEEILKEIKPEEIHAFVKSMIIFNVKSKRKM